MARVAYIITLASALAPNRWDAPPHTSRQLQQALGDCPTADYACALLQERAHDGNEVNVAATLVRAAREGASRSTLRYLYGACRASAGRMAPRQLANAARALRLANDEETAEREAALVAVCACVAMTPPAEWTNAREVAMAAWACGDACAKGRADEQAVYALRTLSNAAPRGFAAREASDVAWALAAARERLLPPAATDNATVADVAAFLDRLADHARSVSYAPRDVATALWACAKIAEADWRAQAASLRAVAALRANADRIKGPWPPRDAAQAAAAVASAAVDAPEVLDRATAAAARGCDRWSLRDVADVLWACARLDRPPAADAVAALCGARAVRRASAELRPNTRGRAELCSVAWAAACLAHESERHLDAAVDTVAAAHGALAADADDDGARDAGSPTLGDAPTPPGAPMARTRRLRALHHARLALAAAGASEEQLQTVDAATTNELRRAARAAWTRRPSAPSSRHEAVSKVLRGMKAQHGVVACVEIKILRRVRRPPRHRRDAYWLISTQVVATAHDEHGGLAVDVLVRLPDGRAVAVEVDGPSHFCADDPKRPLGHTRLKRRLLEHAGLEAVSVPYYEWDRIPHWSSMERERYLQRKLGITTRLVYDSGDSSSFAPLEGERGASRLA